MESCSPLVVLLILSVVFCPATESVSLEPPSVTLGEDCPDGYVLENALQCTCNLVDPDSELDSAKVEVVWYDAEDNEIQAEARQAVLWISEINKQYYPEATFKCQARATYTHKPGNVKTFEARFAFGPDRVFVSLETTEKKEMTDRSTKILCSINRHTRHPDNTMDLNILQPKGSGHVGIPQRRMFNESYRTYAYTYEYEKPGRVTVECVARNTIYPRLKATARTFFFVFGVATVELKDCAHWVTKTSICLCRLVEQGYPIATPKWYDEVGNVISESFPSVTLNMKESYDNKMLTCQAESEFGGSNMLVYNPKFAKLPEKPPVFKLRVNRGALKVFTDDVLNVDLDDSLVVRCSVQGGSPSVNQILITIGSRIERVDGHEGSAKMIIDENYDKTQVTCGASHIAGRYDKVTTFTIVVKLPAKISQFRINGQTAKEVHANQGETISFECLAQGNPAPQLSITHQLNGTLNDLIKGSSEGVEGHRISLVIDSSTIYHTDIYICVAVTPSTAGAKERKKRCAEDIAESRNKKVRTLIVNGPPAKAFPEGYLPDVTWEGDGYMTVAFKIISHPDPNSFTLVQVEKGKADGKVKKVHREITGDLYNVEFKTINCRISLAVLKVDEKEIEVNSTYEFTLDNKRGDPITVLFKTTGIPEQAKAESDTKLFSAVMIILLYALGVLCLIGLVLLTAKFVHLSWKGLKGNDSDSVSSKSISAHEDLSVPNEETSYNFQRSTYV